MGLSVVAVDRNPEAPGLEEADVAEVVDFSDVDAVVEVARRHAVDGVLTISADRAVPVVAAVAEALGLPGIGTDTAYVMTQKIAMRRVLADAGVPQPEFAAVRNVHEGYAALERVGLRSEERRVGKECRGGWAEEGEHTKGGGGRTEGRRQ